MTTLTTDPVTTARAGTIRTAVTAAGTAAVVACAGSIAGWFIQADLSRAEASRTPLTIVEDLIAGVAFLVLAVTLPALVRSTRLPGRPASLAALGCAFIGVQAWAMGSVIGHLAINVPAAQFEALGDPTDLLLLLNLPVMIVGLVGFVTLGVFGWRRRAMARGASVLLMVAGLAALLGEFAPAGLLAAAALAWTARTAPDA